MAPSYRAIEAKFGAYHLSSGNVDAHLLTTCLGLLGVAGLVTRACVAASRFSRGGAGAVCDERHSGARGAAFGLWVVYGLLLLVSDVPLGLAAVSAGAVLSVGVVSCKLDVGWVAAFALVGLGYGLQDVAHWYYGEETYQANSWAQGGLGVSAVLELFLEHCFYLLPLTLSCASEGSKAVVALLPLVVAAWGNINIDSDSAWGLPFSAKKSRLLVGKFREKDDVADLATVRAWCVAKGPEDEMTSHWWASDLDEAAGAAFQRLVASRCVDDLFRSKFSERGYVLEPVHGMNELYVSAPVKRAEAAKNSDDVFFTEHVDGPYCFFPFASVFRCIVAVDANVPGYVTHFPNAHRSVEARDGDILAFDFHRESHFITMKPQGAFSPENQDALEKDPTQKWRMVLKLHYAVAPTGLWWCAGKGLHWLSTKYNEAFRALFLATIKPEGLWNKFVADVGVNGATVAYNAMEKYCGFGNIVAYATLGALAANLRSYPVFLYATQFLHYLRYISTYYVRKDVAFGTFKRDVLVFKSVALLQLFALYVAPFLPGGGHLAQDLCTRAEPCFRPDSLVLVAAGYFVSIAATTALGVDGTYFGIELGVVKADYKFVTQFPYNVLPHPMILGQVVALLGVHIVPQIRRRFPLLVPIHVALYLTHLCQESFDYHDGTPWYKKQASSKKAHSAAASSKKKALKSL